MTPGLPTTADVAATVRDACRAAVLAQREVADAGPAAHDVALSGLADALEARCDRLLAANTVDLGRAGFVGLPAAQLERLRLDAARVAALARTAAAAPDPLDAPHPGGHRVRVPVGVVGVAHEGVPDDALDAAVAAVRAGCAVLLRGATAARQTGLALAEAVAEGLAAGGLPATAVQSLDATGREGARHLVRATGLVDLVVARGGAALVRRVSADAAVPLLGPVPAPVRATVDATADPATALAVCAGAWSVLVHADLEHSPVPRLVAARGGEDTAVVVVDDLDAALDHLRAVPGTGTEAVVTGEDAAARRFALLAPAAVVLVNTAPAQEGVRTALSADDLTVARWVVSADPGPG